MVVSDWKPGLDKIRLTKIIRLHTGLGLAESKRLTDEILEGKEVAFPDINSEAADHFINELKECGAITEARSM